MIGLETRHDDPVLLSTAGWRKPVNELYPSDEIIRLAAARGIPFTLASDVHSHAQLGKDYDAWRKRWRVAACAKWLFTIDIGEH